MNRGRSRVNGLNLFVSCTLVLGEVGGQVVELVQSLA